MPPSLWWGRPTLPPAQPNLVRSSQRPVKTQKWTLVKSSQEEVGGCHNNIGARVVGQIAGGGLGLRQSWEPTHGSRCSAGKSLWEEGLPVHIICHHIISSVVINRLFFFLLRIWGCQQKGWDFEEGRGWDGSGFSWLPHSTHLYLIFYFSFVVVVFHEKNLRT